ncbi:hypothetical protein [Flavobacterium filum]|uniref:hypothetical protein n=1 Tax=Flavobacterium filum TaxID=370974 RepID=UPI0004111B54|nr:hypothetical protein [Flavobacterium filum]
MKKFIITILAVFSVTGIYAQTYEFKIVTSVESIVPGGLGRSRVIENNEERDFSPVMASNAGRQKDTKSRKENKAENFKETNLLNFYSMVGINFQNIASNDAILSSMLNAYAQEGWELAFVSSGVESDAGKDDGSGIFITRYVFKRKKE